MKTKKQEKGQILVILAVVLVGILAVTALAVDGSMVYKDRREDQTTADSIALAAASEAEKFTNCADARAAAITKAVSYASAQESITLANDSVSPNRVETYCSMDNTKLDITVTITTDTPTTFAQMASRDELTTQVSAIARVTIGGIYANGNGLVSTGTTCDANGGIYALGNGRIYVHAGGIFSTSCLKATGSSQILTDGGPIFYTGRGATTFMTGTQRQYTGLDGIIFDGTAPVFIKVEADLVPPSLLQYNGNTNTPNPAVPQSEWPIPSNEPLANMDFPGMTPPSCPGPARTPVLNWQAETLYPGNYANGIDQGSGALTLQPGVYCIAPNKNILFDQATVMADGVVFYFQGAGNFTTGGAVVLSMNNSSVYLTNGNFYIPNGSITADNITIHIQQGNFNLSNGAQNIVMNGPDCNTSACGVGPSIKGVLLWMAKTNTGTITVANGVNPHRLHGTMYAPNAKAYFSGGTTTNAINVQLVAKRIEVSNGAILNMDIDGAILYSQATTSIELLK